VVRIEPSPPFTLLSARLPPARIPAAVCHSKDDEVAAVHPKIDLEGKPAHNRATDFTMNQRKPRRVRCDALEGLVNGVREPRAKSRPLLFVPLPRRAASSSACGQKTTV
jgi:hypothetical protein